MDRSTEEREGKEEEEEDDAPSPEQQLAQVKHPTTTAATVSIWDPAVRPALIKTLRVGIAGQVFVTQGKGREGRGNGKGKGREREKKGREGIEDQSDENKMNTDETANSARTLFLLLHLNTLAASRPRAPSVCLSVCLSV